MKRGVLKLLLKGLHVIAVDMSIPKDVHKVARPQPTDLRNHAGKQRVGGDVEGDAKPHVARALVHLTGELPIRHVELSEVERCESEGSQVLGRSLALLVDNR